MNDVDDIVAEIRKELMALPDFGQFQFHVKRHLGKYVNKETVNVTSIKFSKDEPNIKVTAAIVQMIKAIAEARERGTLTFSVLFNDSGEAEQLSVQDYKKISWHSTTISSIIQITLGQPMRRLTIYAYGKKNYKEIQEPTSPRWQDG